MSTNYKIERRCRSRNSWWQPAYRRCCHRAVSEVWMQQSIMYCGTVLPATRQMLSTSNVWGVDAAVRHVLWYGVTRHPADAGDEQCLRCGCSSPWCCIMPIQHDQFTRNSLHMQIAFTVFWLHAGLFPSLLLSVLLPSVLWCCRLGGRKSIRPVKNWVVGCWHGYLSGARCRLASVKSRLVLPFWYLLTWVVLEKEPLNGRVCVRRIEQTLCAGVLQAGRADRWVDDVGRGR